MAVCERKFRSLPIHGLNTRDPHRAGATVVAFQPVSATGRPSLSWHARRSRSADPHGAATVIPFRLRLSPPTLHSVPPRLQPATKSAVRADQNSVTGEEEEYRQRMFENLLAAAWVGTLMSAGYYMLNVLVAPSVLP
jgi:hypothetical protein